MSPDAPAPIPEAGTPAPKPVAVFQVTLLEDMNVTVSGPIGNLPLAMKVLGMGLSAVADYSQREEGAKLVKAMPAETLRLLTP